MNRLFRDMCKNDGLRQRFMISISAIQVVFSIIVMIILNIQPILWVNVFGLVSLLMSFYVIKQKRAYILYAAFTLYASGSILFTTRFLEKGYGFVYYLIVIIPFGFVILYDIVSFKKMVMSTMAGSLIALITYVLYHLLINEYQPVSGGSPLFQEAVLYINIFMIMVLLFVFSLMFSFRLECSKEREKLMRDQLSYEASHDKLTRLYNRKFIDTLIEPIQRAVGEVYIILADLNDFKKINDTYGHSVGDQVLFDVTNRIQKHLPKEAYALRWGGEEFIVVCLNQNQETIQTYIHEVKQSIEQIRYTEYPNLSISIAMGLSNYNPTQTIDQTIQKADHAMYQDKKEYKGLNR
ncbi:GGDEF domain-containing protein [Acholeplasma manati]|uniref:GGDEF domain-containing protein n=1 Tax=Paracholeplasma manati TaxID=591373 RepID=A0ABT2Y459_9MOLU|nr:GGDEF domain-containing protein [Paracholeplasma manati]MCV2231519.1 GGDEF domain-containing protein [Paracholeplasma manati]